MSQQPVYLLFPAVGWKYHELHRPRHHEDSEDNKDVATAAPENYDNDGHNVNIDNLASSF